MGRRTREGAVVNKRKSTKKQAKEETVFDGGKRVIKKGRNRKRKRGVKTLGENYRAIKKPTRGPRRNQ